MKILYHHRTQMGDAQGIHIQEMMRAFSALGHNVRLVSLVARERSHGNRRLLGALAAKAPGLLYELLALCYNAVGYRNLRKRIEAFRPDFIYERYSLFNFSGALAARRSGIPLCLEVNAPLFLEHSTYGKLFFKSSARRIENWVCNNSSVTIAVSSVLREILAAQGVQAEKVVVMPNGINPKDFSEITDGGLVRKKLGVDAHRPAIGVVGWFREWHGLDLLVKALHQAGLFSEKRILVLLVGDGPAVPGCRQVAKALGVDSSVIFTGAVGREEIPGHIAAVDIAVQPRVTPYACPMKVIEYLAMARAIVAPRQANIMDLLEHGHNALLFTPEDGRDLASKVRSLLDDVPLQRRLSQNARKTIDEKGLSWVENGRRVVEMMRAFCGGPC